MKKPVECKQCGFTTTYTNEVEFHLWSSRPGCPACTKPKRDDDVGDEPEEMTAPESIAALSEWYEREYSAVIGLGNIGLITADEGRVILEELRHAVRSMLGLDPA